MAKPRGYDRGFGSGFGVGRYHYELTPWQWMTVPMPHWGLPASAVGRVDLRPLPAQAVAGGTPSGFCFAASMQPLGGIQVVRSLHMVEENTTSLMQDAWQAAMTYRPQGAKLVDLLWDQLTNGSDPEGLDGPKPLMPGVDLQLKLFVGGHSLVKSERFRFGIHPHTARVRDLLRRQFESQWEATNGHDHCRRCLDFTCEKYRVDDWREFVPQRLRAHVPGRLPHQTTISDNFNRADQSGLGTASGGFSWAHVVDTMNILSNEARTPGWGATRISRAEADLSSDDHYAQITIVSGAWGVNTRFASGADTSYNGTYGTGYNALRKRIAGVDTELDHGSSVTPTTIKVESDGSSQTMYFDGVSEASGTDTAITGNLRTGIMAGSFDTSADNFEAADLGGGPVNDVITASHGSFTLTGQAATISCQRKIVAAHSTYTLTGNAAGVNTTRYVGCSHGSFALSGQAANIAGQRLISCSHGTYSLTGNAAVINASRQLACSTGTYVVSGQAAYITTAPPFVCDVGSFTLTGNAANLFSQRKIVAAHGTYTLTGYAAQFTGAGEVDYSRGAMVINNQTPVLIINNVKQPSVVQTE